MVSVERDITDEVKESVAMGLLVDRRNWPFEAGNFKTVLAEQVVCS